MAAPLSDGAVNATDAERKPAVAVTCDGWLGTPTAMNSPD
jgi:hypothetical protein